MAQLLFVLESWFATVLWLAAAVAWHARKPRWWRWALVVVLGLVLLMPWAGLIFFIFAFHWNNPLGTPDTWLVLTLLVTVLLAMGWVVTRGLRQDPATGERRAANWPAGRLAVLALIVTVVAQSTLWMADSQMRDQLLDLRRESQVLAQSVAPPPVVDSQNAASLYHRVFDAMGTNFPPGEEIPTEDRPRLDAAPDAPGIPPFRSPFWTDVILSLFDSPNPDGLVFDPRSQRLARFLSEQRDVRALIVRASEMPRCNFGRDFTRPSFDMLLPEVQNLRSLARYLAIDARQAAATGDSSRAKEDLETILRVANHGAEDPFLITVLVSMALEGMTSETLQQILAETPEPGSLLELTPPARMPWLSVLHRSLCVEEAMGVFFLSQFGSELDDGRARELASLMDFDVVIPLYVGALARNLFLRSSAREMRDAYRELRNATYRLENPRPEDWKEFENIEERFQSLIVRQLLPSIRMAGRAALRAEARRRVTAVALGLYRYYHAAGPDGTRRHAFPESTSALVPDYLAYLPSDPFTLGQPLRYRVVPEGVIVYSIGDNLADDGGVEEEKSKDIVFRCFAPPK